MNTIESKCPFLHGPVRPEIPEPPVSCRSLPVDKRGYPVPFFVAWIDGEPEFRAADAKRIRACKLAGLCTICGQGLGDTFAFVIGPMCGINRTTAEPPCHPECANWSVRACPFLSRPKMQRRLDAGEERVAVDEDCGPGIAILRNPGVTLIWHTTFYKLFPDGSGGELIEIGPCDRAEWWREGRPATREEVLESIDTGLPFLLEACDQEETEARRIEARAELHRRREGFLEYLPPENSNTVLGLRSQASPE